MIVRASTAEDHSQWAAMRARLWPDADPDELERELADLPTLNPPAAAFMAEQDGRLIGFIELWIRSYAEGGPPAPAAYVEGIWVEPHWRRRGVASALLAAGEDWARAQGVSWIGSDATLDNRLSHAWHEASGFAETERLVVFGKSLGQ